MDRKRLACSFHFEPAWRPLPFFCSEPTVPGPGRILPAWREPGCFQRYPALPFPSRFPRRHIAFRPADSQVQTMGPMQGVGGGAGVLVVFKDPLRNCLLIVGLINVLFCSAVCRRGTQQAWKANRPPQYKGQYPGSAASTAGWPWQWRFPPALWPAEAAGWCPANFGAVSRLCRLLSLFFYFGS